MKVLRAAFVAAFFAVVPVLGATPAHANLSGPCAASGTVDGKTYDAKVTKVVIPRSGTVAWKASVPGDGDRVVAGKVNLKLPWPIPEQELGTWGDKSSKHANNDDYEYDLPSVLAGIDMPLTGSHTEPGVQCAGVVIVRLDGGGVSNPAVIGAFVVLLISGAGLFIALKPKGV